MEMRALEMRTDFGFVEWMRFHDIHTPGFVHWMRAVDLGGDHVVTTLLEAAGQHALDLIMEHDFED